MGFFSGLNAEKYDRQYSDRELVRRIAAFFKPQWKRLLAVTAAVLLVSGAGAAYPLIVSYGVDMLAGEVTMLGISLVALAVLAAEIGRAHV